MHLEFHDVSGESGIVREDYSVDYDGVVNGEVEAIVARVPETRFDATEPPPKAVFQELILDLHAVSLIVSVAIKDGESGSSFEDPPRVHRPTPGALPVQSKDQ